MSDDSTQTTTSDLGSPPMTEQEQQVQSELLSQIEEIKQQDPQLYKELAEEQAQLIVTEQGLESSGDATPASIAQAETHAYAEEIEQIEAVDPQLASEMVFEAEQLVTETVQSQEQQLADDDPTVFNEIQQQDQAAAAQEQQDPSQAQQIAATENQQVQSEIAAVDPLLAETIAEEADSQSLLDVGTDAQVTADANAEWSQLEQQDPTLYQTIEQQEAAAQQQEQASGVTAEQASEIQNQFFQEAETEIAQVDIQLADNMEFLDQDTQETIAPTESSSSTSTQTTQTQT
jgi:hypothetical protein